MNQPVRVSNGSAACVSVLFSPSWIVCRARHRARSFCHQCWCREDVLDPIPRDGDEAGEDLTLTRYGRCSSLINQKGTGFFLDRYARSATVTNKKDARLTAVIDHVNCQNPFGYILSARASTSVNISRTVLLAVRGKPDESVPLPCIMSAMFGSGFGRADGMVAFMATRRRRYEAQRCASARCVEASARVRDVGADRRKERERWFESSLAGLYAAKFSSISSVRLYIFHETKTHACNSADLSLQAVAPFANTCKSPAILLYERLSFPPMCNSYSAAQCYYANSWKRGPPRNKI